MKAPQQNSSQLAAGLLCTLALFILPACQKAKMTTVDKQAAATPLAPTATPPVSPPPIQPVHPTPPHQPSPPITGGTVIPVPQPVPQPPVVIHPPAGGDGGAISVQPNPVRPVLVFDDPTVPLTPATRGPITPQPPVQYRQGGLVTWFDTDHRPHNILPVCRNDECLTPPEPTATDPVFQPEAPITNKLDVLFAVDTSKSLYEEYEQIATNITSYVSALPTGTDFRFAMLIGHGKDAIVDGQSWYGKLWKTPDTSDLAVINVGVLDGSAAQINELSNKLWNKFKGGANRDNIPRDTTRALGEAILSNINSFLRDSFTQNASGRVADAQVFPRRDAAMNIIIVSDENDVCYDYKEANAIRRAAGQSLIFPRFADTGAGVEHEGITRDRPEHQAFTSDLCRYNGSLITFDMVAAALRHYYPTNAEGSNNMPLIMSGILYKSNEEIPRSNDQFAGDNEAGWGYLDLISGLGGEPVSLADSNFGSNLANIGDLSRFRMQYENSIPLMKDGEWLDLRTISLNSFVIEVIKASGETMTIDTSFAVLKVIERDQAGSPLRGSIEIRRDALENIIGPGDQMIVYYSAEDAQG